MFVVVFVFFLFDFVSPFVWCIEKNYELDAIKDSFIVEIFAYQFKFPVTFVEGWEMKNVPRKYFNLK